MEKLTRPLSAHDIYEYLTTGDGTSLLDEAQAATRSEWDAEEHRADLIRKQSDLIRDGWEGSVGDAASGAVDPIASEGLVGVVHLAQAKEFLDRQSGAFHQARNSVVPVSQEPPEMDIVDMMTPFSDYEQQVTDYQSEVQHNIDVFRTYDEASGFHEVGMGDYQVSDQSGGDISVTSDDGRPDDTGGDHGDVREVVDREQPRGESGPPVGGRVQPGSDSTDMPGATAPAARSPLTTTPSGFAPPSVIGPGQSSPVQPTPTGPAPGASVAGLPVGGYPGGGTGGPGARGAYGGGPGAGRVPGGGIRPGVPGAGPGVGALAAEEAAARRAASAAAARGAGSGMMGGAPVGGGRGKGDDDEEHRRKVLIEEDVEGVFGSDVLTAPQVIGDDAYEDD